MVKITKEAALEYHLNGRPGKIEVKPTKPYHTQTDLSLAYSPGVAFPCLEIQNTPDDVYKYTSHNRYNECCKVFQEDTPFCCQFGEATMIL